MNTEYTEQEIMEFLKENLREFQKNFPMTPKERKELRKWVKAGNDVHSNPWYYSNENGYPMNYVEAMRFAEEMF